MAKWRVTIPELEIEVEADDEGDALLQADGKFSVMNGAYAELIEQDDPQE